MRSRLNSELRRFSPAARRGEQALARLSQAAVSCRYSPFGSTQNRTVMHHSCMYTHYPWLEAMELPRWDQNSDNLAWFESRVSYLGSTGRHPQLSELLSLCR